MIDANEVDQLKAEIKELREALNRADGTWAALRARLSFGEFKTVEEVYKYVLDKRAYAPASNSEGHSQFVKDILSYLNKFEETRYRRG